MAQQPVSTTVEEPPEVTVKEEDAVVIIELEPTEETVKEENIKDEAPNDESDDIPANQSPPGPPNIPPSPESGQSGVKDWMMRPLQDHIEESHVDEQDCVQEVEAHCSRLPATWHTKETLLRGFAKEPRPIDTSVSDCVDTTDGRRLGREAWHTPPYSAGDAMRQWGLNESFPSISGDEYTRGVPGDQIDLTGPPVDDLAVGQFITPLLGNAALSQMSREDIELAVKNHVYALRSLLDEARARSLTIQPVPYMEYPPHVGNYPPQDEGYSNMEERYPPMNERPPAMFERYPDEGGRYPVQDGRYPSHDGGHPVQDNGYANGGYPAHDGGYPAQIGRYPILSGGYPAQNARFPNQVEAPSPPDDMNRHMMFLDQFLAESFIPRMAGGQGRRFFAIRNRPYYFR